MENMSFEHFKVGNYGNVKIVKRDILMPGDEESDTEFINLENIDGSKFVTCYIEIDEKGEFISLSQEDVQEIGFDCTIVPSDCFEFDDTSNRLVLRYSDRVIEPNSEFIPVEDKQLEIVDSAETIHSRITENFFNVEKTLYEICVDLKTVRDNKYYKTLGFNTFEDYCSMCFNIRQSQAYKYCSIAENLSSDFFHSSGNIGINKLYILSRLSDSERTEILETTDIENTSVKQVEEKAKKIRQNRGVTEGETSPTSPSKSTSKENQFIDIYGEKINAFVLLFAKRLRECSNLLSYKNIFDGSYMKIDSDYICSIANSLPVLIDGLQRINRIKHNVDDDIQQGNDCFSDDMEIYLNEINSVVEGINGIFLGGENDE